MKKNSLIICILVIFFLVFFSGCQEQTSEEGKNQTTNQDNTPTNTSNGDQHNGENMFLGHWQVVDTGFVYETWAFYENLSAKNYLILEDYGEQIEYVYWFNYTRDNTTLCFLTGGSPDSGDYFSICYSYLFSENGDILRFSYNDIVIMNLTKIPEE